MIGINAFPGGAVILRVAAAVLERNYKRADHARAGLAFNASSDNFSMGSEKLNLKIFLSR